MKTQDIDIIDPSSLKVVDGKAVYTTKKVSVVVKDNKLEQFKGVLLADGTTIDPENPIVKLASKSMLDSYKTRINALLETGRVSKDYIESTITPMLSGLSLSFDENGKPEATPVDAVLKACEALPAYGGLNGKKLSGSGKNGKRKVEGFELALTEETNPDEGMEDLALADPDKIVDQQFAASGYGPEIRAVAD